MMNSVFKKIKQVRNRTKCFDLFHHTKIDGNKIYPNYQHMNRLVNYRVVR